MIRAFFLALGHLLDPRILWVIAKVILLTLALFLLFGVVGYALLVLAAPQLGYRGGETESALFALLVTLALGWFLFRIVAMLVMGIFSDEVVEVVERKYYPAAATQARKVGFGRGLRLGLASTGRAIGYNLLAAPLYIGLLVTGVGLVAALVGVNGLLLGRDLQDMVMARHMHDGMMAPLPRGTRIALGVIVAVLFLVPFVNFLAPVIGAAMAVHLTHAPRPFRSSDRIAS